MLNKKNRNGFTLIELLAVIVVLAIIMVIATTSVNRTIRKAREDANDANLGMIADSVDMCISQENDEKKCNRVSKLQGLNYLDEFEDPFTGESTNLDNKYIIKTDDDLNTTVYYIGIGNSLKEFCLNGDSECFYVYGNSTKTYLAISKYNLLVGYTVDVQNDISKNPRSINNSTEGYALQNADATAWKKNVNTYKGVIEFSTGLNDGIYWKNGEEMKDEYGSDYPVDIYDDNSKLYNYINNYKTYLENKSNDNIVDARLISYRELLGLGCTYKGVQIQSNGVEQNYGSCENAPSWVYNSSYWTSTLAYFNKSDNSNVNKLFLWVVYSDGRFTGSGYPVDLYRGLRPVIEINRSDVDQLINS